ncbi:MAG: hypothetical protein VKJ64_17515 [Leptolyngbyaceae bacterium]|nr:hypothetical protein [Leptolyngbyaceae bacterium]
MEFSRFNVMVFLYCFGNASLAQRVLASLRQAWRSHLHCVTVIFLNDFWLVRFIIDPALDLEAGKDWQAFLNENGIPYVPTPPVSRAFDDLDLSMVPVIVMKRHNIAIVSHGLANPLEVRHFQENVVAGLGYRPPSLV